MKNRNVTFSMLSKIFLALLAISMFSCSSIYTGGYKRPKLVDKKTSLTTKLLRKKLFLVSKQGFAVGHEDGTAYGIGWKQADNPDITKSDVYDMISDHPALYGFDLSKLELAKKNNIDGVPFDTMRKLIIDAYRTGGIITISWHMDNPTSGGDSWDPTPAVSDILDGGKYRDKYELWVGRVAAFFKSLHFEYQPIPIIFRPFHEMNGSWFWWGEGNCRAEDYKKLWQQTVELLRDKHNVHNLLYTYSPNKLNPTDDYLKYYPGDKYVDILGSDIYDFGNSEDYIKSVKSDLALVRTIATEKDKLFAFTETGLEKIPTEKWFTNVLYPSIKDSGICWVLFWRNNDETHHYLPFKGHVNELDFIEFAKLPQTLFLKDLNNLTN